MRRTASRASLVLLFALGGALNAQQTWIVDDQLRAGAHFSDLPAAVAAASPGDIVECRKGVYTAPTVSLGITVFGNESVLLGVLEVRGVPTGQAFAMADFGRRNQYSFLAKVSGNLGHVHLEGLTSGRGKSVPTTGPAVLVENSLMVSLERCVAYGDPAVRVVNSRVALHRCALGKFDSISGRGHCLELEDADASVTFPSFDAELSSLPAIIQRRGQLVVAGAPLAGFVQGGQMGVAQVAIENVGGALTVGNVEFNPRSSAAPIRGAFITASVPTVSVVRPSSGAAFRLRVQGFQQSAVLLAVSAVSAPPRTAPALPWWPWWFSVDVPTALFVSAQATSMVGDSWTPVTVPAFLPRGTLVSLQALVSRPSEWNLSTPTVWMIR